MDDRELLKYAAMVAGVCVVGNAEGVDGFMGLAITGPRPIWNPLKDKQDAERLAARLNIKEESSRAIVEAAAEIGKSADPLFLMSQISRDAVR